MATGEITTTYWRTLHYEQSLVQAKEGAGPGPSCQPGKGRRRAQSHGACVHRFNPQEEVKGDACRKYCVIGHQWGFTLVEYSRPQLQPKVSLEQAANVRIQGTKFR